MVRIRTDSQNIAIYTNIVEIYRVYALAVNNGPTDKLYAIFNERKLVNC
jgi:uncharacterized protein (DUF39 family)